MVTDDLITDPGTRCAIEALIVEHSWMIDHHQSERLGQLYLENGRYTGIVGDIVGRPAINEYGRKRAAMTARASRHVNTNIRLLKDGPDRIRGTCTILLFRHSGEGMGSADPIAVADAEDIFVRCEDGQWRFEERHLILRFESEAHRR